jgi:Fe-S cluster assembly iron-binding protein IscA
MLNVSDKAIQVIEQALDSNEVEDKQALRLAKNDDGEFGLALDEQKDGDQVIAKEERALLYVDSEVSNKLDGATLDVVDSPGGVRLALSMPNNGGQ